MPDWPQPFRSNSGFVLPAAIFLLVVLVGLAGWMMQLTLATQAQDALTVEGERAYQAAQAGLEAGIYAARHGGCAAQTLVFTGTLARFTANVSCTSSTADEGGVSHTFYQVTSVACNQPESGMCPNPDPTLPEYAERHLGAVIASD